MNFPELKQNFYKRYEQSSSFLHYVSQGALCPLLGYVDIPYAPSVTCALSMRMQMFARLIGGDAIKIENAASDAFFTYRQGEPAGILRGNDSISADIINSLSMYNIRGAEILYSSTLPDFMQSSELFAVALTEAIKKANNIECGILETAAICAQGKNINPYLAMLSARGGYCTMVSSGEPQKLPLPFSGYKIISVFTTEKQRDKERIKHIEYAMSKITRLYPHVGSIGDVTCEMVDRAQIRDKTAEAYMYHLAEENIRIQAAQNALKRCMTKTLFEQINLSQESMEKYWNTGSEHLSAVQCAKGLDGVEAVRDGGDRGVIVIADNDSVNYVTDMIKQDFETNIGYQPTFCISAAD